MIDWNAMPGRRCAICGKPQTPQLGGLGGFRAKLKLPDSGYAHVKCLFKTRHWQR
jgi:hypothetical protein